MHGLNFYDYGARQYDPILGRFTQIDPLCEKYYNFHPYAYCKNNPVNATDVEGKYISYFNKELGINYIYYNGDFYQGSLKNVNGHLIPSGNRIATSDLPNSHAYRTLTALRKMDNSSNEIVKKVFDTLSNLDSGIMHRINGRTDKKSHTTATGGQTSVTYLNFNDVDNVDIYRGDFKDVGLTDYELVGHELKHACDIDFYKNKQETDKRGIKFTEYETVNFENLIRKEEGNPLRTKYTFEIPSDIWGKVTIWN